MHDGTQRAADVEVQLLKRWSTMVRTHGYQVPRARYVPFRGGGSVGGDDMAPVVVVVGGGAGAVVIVHVPPSSA